LARADKSLRSGAKHDNTTRLTFLMVAHQKAFTKIVVLEIKAADAASYV